MRISELNSSRFASLLSSATLALFSLGALPVDARAQDRVPVITVEELAEGLWVIRDGLGSGNVLLYDVIGGAYLVDAGASASATAIVATVDSLAANPVRTVISTHYHEDHLGANAWYAVRGARIMGHELLASEAMRDTTIEEINKIMKDAAEGELKGVLAYNDEPLVSIDFNHDPASSTFDAGLTKVMQGNLVKVISWYDNEWGFSNRMLDTAIALYNAK